VVPIEATRRYGQLWRIQGAPVLLVFGLVGRLGISMEPLGLILLVQHATGRYAAAALASAAYTLAYAGHLDRGLVLVPVWIRVGWCPTSF
jgi:hypothetical protein